MNDQDILGLSNCEPNRVVSIPASQSLHASTASPSSPSAISTGLSRLDEALCPTSRNALSGLGLKNGLQRRGIPCGHVTEIFGPPGVGKTSLALEIAINALCDGGKAVWIDTGSPLPKPRLEKMLRKKLAEPTRNTSSQSTAPTAVDEMIRKLTYFRSQSLPHLLALLLHPPQSFPGEGTTLLIIDSISGPFPPYFPSPLELRSRLFSQDGGKNLDKSQIQWLVNRKWNVTGDLANQLTKLAVTFRLAVVVVNQTQTRIRGLPRAILSPALAGSVWENDVYARVGLYRDLALPVSVSVATNGNEDNDKCVVDLDLSTNKIRFAEVMKRGGKPLTSRLEENIVPFIIKMDGLLEVINKTQTQSNPVVASASPPLSSGRSQNPRASRRSIHRKRKLDEIADSQDEDEDEGGFEEVGDSDEEYGWIDEDACDVPDV